ncbi:hypothetical protein D3C85_1563610 [compost metagenome]
MNHRDVTGMEPAALKCVLRGRRVFQVTHHHRIAPQQQFTGGLAVMGYRLECFRVGHHQTFKRRSTGALTNTHCRFF